jgi:hypothetical protein
VTRPPLLPPLVSAQTISRQLRRGSFSLVLLGTVLFFDVHACGSRCTHYALDRVVVSRCFPHNRECISWRPALIFLSSSLRTHHLPEYSSTTPTRSTPYASSSSSSAAAAFLHDCRLQIAACLPACLICLQTTRVGKSTSRSLCCCCSSREGSTPNNTPGVITISIIISLFDCSLQEHKEKTYSQSRQASERASAFIHAIHPSIESPSRSKHNHGIVGELGSAVDGGIVVDGRSLSTSGS